MDKKIIIIIVLSLIIIGVAGVYAYDKIRENILLEGASIGYDSAVNDLLSEVVKCQPVPISIGNQTIEIIAIHCIQNAQEKK